jgi:uncharacterized membrane protein YfcA
VNGILALSLGLSTVIGVLLGLLGGGGSTLTVPLLTFITGLGIRDAITTSLVVVGVTSAVGAIAHARAGRVQWQPAVVLGASGMVGAYVGGRVATHIPERIAMVVFAAIMIASALALLRDRGHGVPAGELRLPTVRAVLLGFVVGVVSGLTGAGGGFLLVGALTMICGVAISVAVGTSLAVIAMHCFAALAGRLDGTQINWKLAAMVTVAAIAGSLIGERLVAIIDPHGLKTGFGVLALLMGFGIVGSEVHSSGGVELAEVLLVVATNAVWRWSRTHHLTDWLTPRPARRLRLSRGRQPCTPSQRRHRSLRAGQQALGFHG